MGTNGPNEVTMSTADDAEDSVEIKIKTLDSQTYTLRVNKCVPVPALKEQIATVTGVLSEQQRLICRGKVLRDDQLLSAYHVEDGHTLHLVSRQSIPSSSAPTSSTMASEGAGHQAFSSASSSAHNRGNHITHSFVYDIDQGDRSTTNLGRFISGLLNSIATANAGTGNARSDLRETAPERPDRVSSNVDLSDGTHPQANPAASRVEFDSRQAAFRYPSAVNMGFQQPAVIPDSLTTIHQYLGHMRDAFRREAFRDVGGEINNNVDTSGVQVNEGQNHDSESHSFSGQGGLPSPASLAEIMLSARELLIEQAGGRLLQLAGQLENQVSVTDPLMRTNIQSSAFRSGLLLQNLGSFFLELGRTTMTLRMGQTPTEAAVNAGPAVFISASGPNPMMIQPVPFYPGSSFGGLPMGAANSSHGLEGQPLGSTYIPRNVDIRIHAGHTIPVATANLGEQTGAQQTQEQTDATRNSPGTNFIHQAFSGPSGGASLAGETGVRVVPIRTVVAVPAGVGRSTSDSSGRPTGLFYPLFARIQHQNHGNVNDARGSQSSTETHTRGHEIDQLPTLESSTLMRDGNHLPENPVPIVYGMSPTNESLQDQGSTHVFISSQSPPNGNNNGIAQAHDGQHTGQGSVAQMLSRFDQQLRNVLTGEEINASGVSRQDSATGSTNQAGPAGNSETQEASIVGETQGVFFSDMVRQLMPYLSQGTATVPGGSSTVHNSSTGQDERENSTYPSGSQSRRDPPESPNSKRPKRD